MRNRATTGFAGALMAMMMLAVFATAAFADPQYNGGAVGGETTGGGDVAGQTVTGSGTLPFTGADLALYVVAGIAIVAAGLGLRRVSAARASR
jgi:hypothetical protein